jgi:hypothetical protein
LERVAFLIEETNQRIGCLLNPESLLMQRVAGVRPMHAATGPATGTGLSDAPLLYTGGGRTQLELALLFDVSLAGSSIATGDVRELTAPLWNLAENAKRTAGYGRPPLVRFVWGKSWNIPGIVVAVAERLEDFTPAGVPRRSWLRLRMLRVSEPPPTAFSATRAQAAPLALPQAGLAQDALATHTPMGGEPESLSESEPASPWVDVEGILSAALAETPAGQTLEAARREVTLAIDRVLAEVMPWISAAEETPEALAMRAEVGRMADSAQEPTPADPGQLLGQAAGAAASVSASADAISAAIQDPASPMEPGIVERIDAALGGVAPATGAVLQAAQAVAQAVKARAAEVWVEAVDRMELGADAIDNALSGMPADAGALAQRTVETALAAVKEMRGLIQEQGTAGQPALTTALPDVLSKVGVALDDLRTAGETGAAKVIHAAISSMSSALQRMAAAAEAIQSASAQGMMTAAKLAADAIRSSLDGAPAGDGIAAAQKTRAAWQEIVFSLEGLRLEKDSDVAQRVSQALDSCRASMGQVEAPADAAHATALDALGALYSVLDALDAADQVETAGQISAARARSQEAALAAPGGASPGERLDQIAFQYYGDPAAWRVLARANGLDDPLRLSARRPLRIPSLSASGGR